MAKDPKNKKKFFKNFKAELKKVIWPTPKQIVNNTLVVVTIVLLTAVIVFALDLTFDLINNAGINKLKEKIVQNDDTSIVENQVEGENTESETTTTTDNENSNDEIDDSSDATSTENAE